MIEIVLVENRRRAEFITPLPKPKKRTGAAQQASIVFDEGKGLSTEKQRYDHTAVINSVRQQVDHTEFTKLYLRLA